MATDYAALAKQAGAISSTPAKVDYTALAKQAGAISSVPAAAPQQQPPPQSMTDRLIQGAVDLGAGALKGAGSTANAIGTMLIPDRLVRAVGGTPPTQQQVDKSFAPSNTTQTVGKGLEQAAEFFVPGGAEEALGAKIAAKFPRLAKVGTALLSHPSPELNAAGKIVMQALSAGAVNKAQGGTFAGGAAGGAVAGGIGEGVKALAPVIAETAMGVRAADRASANRAVRSLGPAKPGDTMGRFILDNTAGSDPAQIAEQARNVVNNAKTGLENAAVQSSVPVDLLPARTQAASFANTAVKQNNPSTIREVGKIGELLDARGQTPIPQFVSADEGLALRRGVDDLHGSWAPAGQRDLSDAAIAGTRNALNDELERAIPGFRDFNSTMTVGIPTANRIGATDLNAGVAQRVFGRLARPTGALAGAGIGGTVGYKEDGVQGALLGGAAGLVLPEVATSPTTLMRVARAADSAAPAVAARAAQGLTAQATRSTGYKAWSELGAAKLQDHIGREGDAAGISQADVDAIAKTPQGQQLLIQAGDLDPGSKAMKNLVTQIKALKQ